VKFPRQGWAVPLHNAIDLYCQTEANQQEPLVGKSSEKVAVVNCRNHMLQQNHGNVPPSCFFTGYIGDGNVCSYCNEYSVVATPE
jgi:hypothetical protein